MATPAVTPRQQLLGCWGAAHRLAECNSTSNHFVFAIYITKRPNMAKLLPSKYLGGCNVAHHHCAPAWAYHHSAFKRGVTFGGAWASSRERRTNKKIVDACCGRERHQPLRIAHKRGAPGDFIAHAGPEHHVLDNADRAHRIPPTSAETLTFRSAAARKLISRSLHQMHPGCHVPDSWRR